MPVDPTLKELADLLLVATRSGVLKWQPGVVDGIVTGRVGKMHYILNVSESPIEQGPASDDRDWLITLDVRESVADSVFKKSLSGLNAADRESIQLLREVWEAATAGSRQVAADRLRTAVESLRRQSPTRNADRPIRAPSPAASSG